MIQNQIHVLKIAFRNVTRNSKSNRFVIISIACGIAALFWIKSIFLGHNQNMINVAASTSIGQVQIHSHDFLKQKSIMHHFSMDGISERLDGVPDTVWGPRVYFPSLISTAFDSSMGLVYGVEAAKESQITDLVKHIKEGTYLSSEETNQCKKREIIISQRQGKKLRAELGSKIVLMGQAVDGTTGNDLFHVVGLFDSGSPDFDDTHSFVSFQCAQELSAVGSDVHEIVVKGLVHQTDQTIQQLVKDKLESDTTFKLLDVTTWREFLPNLSTMIKMNSSVSNLMTLVFLLVTTLGIVNSMLMSVFERSNEFGVLLALGVTPRQVKQIVLYESAMIALMSGVIGAIVGFSLVVYNHHYGMDISGFLGEVKSSFVGFKFQTMVYPEVNPFLFLAFFGIEFVFILVAGLYPAYKAASLNPIDSIRSR